MNGDWWIVSEREREREKPLPWLEGREIRSSGKGKRNEGRGFSEWKKRLK